MTLIVEGDMKSAKESLKCGPSFSKWLVTQRSYAIEGLLLLLLLLFSHMQETIAVQCQ